MKTNTVVGVECVWSGASVVLLWFMFALIPHLCRRMEPCGFNYETNCTYMDITIVYA